MEICKYCKKQINKDIIKNHESYCVYNFNFNNNLIPCEICNNLIEFDNYNEHISHCNPIIQISNQNPIFFFNRINIPNRNINSNSLQVTNQNENINTNYLQEIQIPEVQTCLEFQVMMENIHNETYSLLIDTYITNEDEKTQLLNAIEHFPIIKQKTVKK